MENQKINYVLNLNEIMRFVFDDNVGRNVDSEITETYVNTDAGILKLDNKISREIKTKGDNSAQFTIRYDLIKLFINSLLEIPADMEEGMTLSLGESLIINTMLNENLLSVIKINENGKE